MADDASFGSGRFAVVVTTPVAELRSPLRARERLPRATYGNVERGRQRVPVDVIWRLAVILNVPIQALLPEPRREKKSEPADTLGLAGTAHAHILSDAVPK